MFGERGIKNEGAREWGSSGDVRDSADTSLLQSRHINVPNVQWSDHMQRLEEVSEKLKVRRRKGGSVVL